MSHTATMAWGAYVILGCFVAVWLGSIAIVADAARRRPRDFAGLWETRWLYIAVAAVYAIPTLARQAPAVDKAVPAFGVIQVVGIPVVLVLGVAYLLRVVFPTPARAALREAAGAPGGTGEDEAR